MDFIIDLPPLGLDKVTNLLVVIDRSIKGVILVDIKGIILEDVVNAFLIYFYIYYRLLLAIVSNRGP